VGNGGYGRSIRTRWKKEIFPVKLGGGIVDGVEGGEYKNHSIREKGSNLRGLGWSRVLPLATFGGGGGCYKGRRGGNIW